jgi:hypothetical protein
LNPFDQDGIIEKRFSALKVDPFNRAEVFALLKDLLNDVQSHRAALPGTAPHKAVIALKVALVCEQQMKARELHVSPPFDRQQNGTMHK